MEPLCALGVLLTLLEAGKGQTLKPPPAITPVLQSFQENQVWGWKGGEAASCRHGPGVQYRQPRTDQGAQPCSQPPSRHGNP